LVDVLPSRHVFPVNKSDCDAKTAGATGAANAVKVSFLILGNRVVDHMGHVVNVDASGSNLGCNENLFFATAECGHRLLACLLRHIAV
jgi:hypothetical protein